VAILSPASLQEIGGDLIEVEVEVARVRLVPPPQAARRGGPPALPPWLVVRAHAQDSPDDEDEELFFEAYLQLSAAGSPGPRTADTRVEVPIAGLAPGTHNLDVELRPIDPRFADGRFWPPVRDTVRFVRVEATD